MSRLDGKIAIITGGASGIGLATARLFIKNGAHVIITDRSKQAGEDAASDLGKRASFFEQDVTDEACWPELISFTEQQVGIPNVFVNNAGILGTAGKQELENTDLAEWREVQAINVEGVFLGCRTAVEAMKEGGGSIVNLASVASRQATPELIAYGASKAAVAHLTKTVASHCSRKNYPIRCNSVHPNPIKTAMGDRLMSQIGGNADAGWQIFEKTRAYGGAGEPLDVAQAILFLSSDEARHITGSELMVDGGMSGFS